MRVRVLLFARLKELSGAGSLDLEVPEGATVAEVWRRLQAVTPSLLAFSEPPLAARNLEYAGAETPLSGDDEVAFLPPVSGG
jgi:molybdopterin converting factor subunit 1